MTIEDHGTRAAASETPRDWYSVRVLLEVPASGSQARAYEERITLWRCGDEITAMRQAEREAGRYAESTGKRPIDPFAQGYHLFDEPGHGAEVSTLMRADSRDPESYLRRFSTTGAESLPQGHDPAQMTDGRWFTVRLLIRLDPGATSLGQQLYEERATVWLCADAESALREATAEASSYARAAGEVVSNFAQVYAMSGPPAHGAMVFSLLRESDLEPHDYADYFYDTGTERTRPVDY